MEVRQRDGSCAGSGCAAVVVRAAAWVVAGRQCRAVVLCGGGSAVRLCRAAVRWLQGGRGKRERGREKQRGEEREIGREREGEKRRGYK